MSNYTMEQTACFTGGRPKSLYEDMPYSEKHKPDYLAMAHHVAEFLENLYQSGIRRFISGGAQGFDSIAFSAVQILKRSHPDVENVIYIPFNHQDSRWAETGLFSKQAYHKMLGLADNVIVCDATFQAATEPFGKVARKLMERNECMVNDSCVVIGQYPNDSWTLPTTKGGTANCLRYASDMGRQLYVNDFRPQFYQK